LISGAGGTTFAANHYSMGVDIANGSWSSPNYSDLIIGYHTGIRIGAGYSGIRFYDNSPTTDTNNTGNGNGAEELLMTIGGGGSPTSGAHVTVHNNLIVGGTVDGVDISVTATDLGATIPNRIYVSNDSNIKHVDLASMRSLMNVTAKTGYQGREQSSSNQAYWVGTMGWAATDFNTLFSYGSGHIEAWSSPANQPSTETTHWVGHQSLHHYASTSSQHGHQFVVGAGNPAYCYLRGVWGAAGTWSSWAKMWNSANDGSGSGLDADLLDGFNSSQGESANTVAVRTVNGYLHSSYFNGTGTFATSGNTSGMGIFTGTNGSDTYGRSYTAAAARTLLNVADGANNYVLPASPSFTHLFINDYVYHSSDTNTYMGFDSADNWRVVTGGTTRMQVDNSTTTMFNNISMSSHTLDMNNNAIYGVNQIFHEGDTNTYTQFHAADQWRVVTGGAERLEVNNSQITSTEPIYAPSFHGDGSSLTGIAAGAGGGGNDQIFWENGQNVTASYTVTNGKNAMSAGPITINSGVTVTVGAGETWTVV
jgi:hypothetical protein